MSLQQALEVVRLQHVFWHKELCRAPDDDLADCQFFRQQCEDEIALLESELEIPATHRVRSQAPRKPPERSLSNARPATTKIGGPSMSSKAARSTRARR